MPEQSLSLLFHIFSIRHIIDFFHIETLDNTSALHLRAILNSEKHEQTKPVTLNKPKKGH